MKEVQVVTVPYVVKNMMLLVEDIGHTDIMMTKFLNWLYKQKPKTIVDCNRNEHSYRKFQSTITSYYPSTKWHYSKYAEEGKQDIPYDTWDDFYYIEYTYCCNSPITIEEIVKTYESKCDICNKKDPYDDDYKKVNYKAKCDICNKKYKIYYYSYGYGD